MDKICCFGWLILYGIGHEQLDELDVSDNQIGVPQYVVSLHTPGIVGPTCMEKCSPYN